jgi:hypothetical protein
MQTPQHIGLVILLDFDFGDSSVREKDWRCRKREMWRREPAKAISPD